MAHVVQGFQALAGQSLAHDPQGEDEGCAGEVAPGLPQVDHVPAGGRGEIAAEGQVADFHEGAARFQAGAGGDGGEARFGEAPGEVPEHAEQGVGAGRGPGQGHGLAGAGQVVRQIGQGHGRAKKDALDGAGGGPDAQIGQQAEGFGVGEVGEGRGRCGVDGAGGQGGVQFGRMARHVADVRSLGKGRQQRFVERPDVEVGDAAEAEGGAIPVHGGSLRQSAAPGCPGAGGQGGEAGHASWESRVSLMASIEPSPLSSIYVVSPLAAKAL